MKPKLTGLLLAGALLLPLCSWGETPELTIVIKNHRFDPTEIRAPAGKKFKLVIDNRDPTPEEFESHDLQREKVVAGNSKATLWVGPLKPGTYSFVGEYHEATAKGTLIVK
jgi:plastocyanin